MSVSSLPVGVQSSLASNRPVTPHAHNEPASFQHSLLTPFPYPIAFADGARQADKSYHSILCRCRLFRFHGNTPSRKRPLPLDECRLYVAPKWAFDVRKHCKYRIDGL